ncbi:type IV pilus modification protein PilV [Luteimonas sp. BDR2-5]|uniref:type IV pilus modification protein PilV n=1 Tax=Proluteimonas luteida TaxID=2878685 RepID=UPI001E590490|nr:type IV pilus modification protein PilV [Luteimonas sp. BDR2-5]MCD9029780.1 type IV pilus modification protein PilV [Luteimonas sp. BDR2-5]
MSRAIAQVAPRQSGFSLIEVMVAVLVLGVGLLGFAFLQTANVRFTQSAAYRTQATNFAYELLDQMRANRVSAPEYVGDYPAADADCEPYALGDHVSTDDFRGAWSCRLSKALGENATARVSRDGNTYTVHVVWNDERWQEGGFEPDLSVGSEL